MFTFLLPQVWAGVKVSLQRDKVGKGKNSNFTVEGPGKYHLNQSKENITNNKPWWCHVDIMWWEGQLSGILPWNPKPQSNHDKASDTHKLRDVPQNTWPVLFRSIKVVENKERLRKYHRLEETSQLNAVRHPEQDPGTGKGHWWKQ